MVPTTYRRECVDYLSSKIVTGPKLSDCKSFTSSHGSICFSQITWKMMTGGYWFTDTLVTVEAFCHYTTEVCIHDNPWVELIKSNHYGYWGAKHKNKYVDYTLVIKLHAAFHAESRFCGKRSTPHRFQNLEKVHVDPHLLMGDHLSPQGQGSLHRCS